MNGCVYFGDGTNKLISDTFRITGSGNIATYTTRTGQGNVKHVSFVARNTSVTADIVTVKVGPTEIVKTPVESYRATDSKQPSEACFSVDIPEGQTVEASLVGITGGGISVDVIVYYR